MVHAPILVTGGAGYIGSHAVLALLEKGEEVVVLDNLSTGEKSRIPAGVFLARGDVGDRDMVRGLLAKYGFEAILHFAGVVKVEESMREPERYRRINVEETKVLADEARAARVPYFLFSSSASVYGNPQHIPISEDAPLSPISPYAETKRDAEEALRMIFSDAVHYSFMRYFNVAGVDPDGRSGYSTKEKPTHLIRSAVRAAVREEEFTINGNDYPTPDGTCIRDYIHVSDLVDAHLAVLEHLRAGGVSRVFNCGTGRGYSNAEVLKSVERIAGSPMRVRIGPRRPGDPAATVADTERISREIGWKPRFGLDDMIRHELSWTRAHL